MKVFVKLIIVYFFVFVITYLYFPNVFLGEFLRVKNMVSADESFSFKKNVILIGWDGVQRDHLYELLEQNKLPNFKKYFIDQGSCSETVITTGTAQTKPGWAEILTGYDPQIHGVYSNDKYAPIPKGYTIFERLEDFLGKDNIVTLFIAGKKNNVAARGPHKLCMNCRHRDIKTNRKLRYWDENSSELIPYKKGAPLIFEQREGEPYFFTKENIDYYIHALGRSKNVLRVAFEYLQKYVNQRFFMFLHFEEPDEQGHIYGENSQEYSEAIIENDQNLKKVIQYLKKLGIRENTELYIVTDHGMDEGKHYHRDFKDTFFCSDSQKLMFSGDRKDITPTLLMRYGIDVSNIEPPLKGRSLGMDVK